MRRQELVPAILYADESAKRMPILSQSDPRRPNYRLQRRVISVSVVTVIVTVLLFAFISWQRTTIGNAQTPEASTTSGPDNAISARVDELSKSQDRLAVEVIGIAGVIGTGFLILFGVGVYQSNRNIEREANHIQELAEARLDKAIREMEEKLEPIIQEGTEAAIAAIEDARRKTVGLLFDELGKSKELIGEKATEAVKQISTQLAVEAEILAWSMENELVEVKEFNKSASEENVRRRATSLFEMAVLAHRLAEQVDGRPPRDLRALEYQALTASLTNMMVGLVTPEQFTDFWYHKSHFDDARLLIAHFESSGQYRFQNSSLSRLIPADRTELSSEDLSRLVEIKTAKQKTTN